MLGASGGVLPKRSPILSAKARASASRHASGSLTEEITEFLDLGPRAHSSPTTVKSGVWSLIACPCVVRGTGWFPSHRDREKDERTGRDP